MGKRLGAGGGKEEVSWRTGYLCEGRGWLTLECRSRYGLLKDNQQLGHATNSNMDPIRSFAVWRRAEASVRTYHRRRSESAVDLPRKMYRYHLSSILRHGRCGATKGDVDVVAVIRTTSHIGTMGAWRARLSPLQRPLSPSHSLVTFTLSLSL